MGPFTIYNHLHQYCASVVAQALCDFKTSTILVYMISTVKDLTGCGLHGYSLVSVIYLFFNRSSSGGLQVCELIGEGSSRHLNASSLLWLYMTHSNSCYVLLLLLTDPCCPLLNNQNIPYLPA